MISHTLEDYLGQCKDYNLIPVYSEFFTDTDTPITLFNKVCKNNEYSYLLESVEGAEHLARYSFIGFEPFLRYWFERQKGYIEERGIVIETTGNPIDILADIMNRYKAPNVAELPRFYGGAVGYFGYDMVRYLEKLPDKKEEELELPECYYILSKVVMIFDHVKHRVLVVVNTQPGDEPEKEYAKAVEQIADVLKKIKAPLIELTIDPLTEKNNNAGFCANMTCDDFVSMVSNAKEYIKAGDIFQVVLSQRFRFSTDKTPFDIYRSLRVINPAPYLFYLNLGSIKVIGSSPEMLVRVEDNKVQTCPIAGTRPRGKNQNEDRLHEEELLKDEKELAEHVMLVDLGRNDLGRVCEYGSINVSDFMKVEKYSHVMHIVTRVTGSLKDGYNCFDTLKACFPAGTVSGAPKVRAMEIIDELEPTARGIYSGVVGYFGFTGNMDTCITIRTVVVHKDVAYVQAGAGIVADSDPENEYNETLNKARAIFETLNSKGGRQ